jgi:hypothetical protein
MSSSNNKQGDDDDDDLEGQMETVLQLMSKRVRGEVTNDQVEAAVTDILSSMGASPPPQNHGENLEAKMESKKIQVDTGNYDDDDDIQEEEKEDANKETPTRISEKTKGSNNETRVKQKQALKKQKEEEKMREDAYQDVISQIPLGKEGSKMMTTFGDGPRPIPKSIEAALLGTRKSLQIAIMDARAIRRRAKQNFEEARQSFVHRNKSSQSNTVDPNMLYRALSGYDRLTLQPKCGFDMEQLTWLFPEEMREYQRWDDMHSESQKNAEDDLKSNDQESVGKEAKEKEDNSVENIELMGGHLKERAAHFDVRTEQMKSEWYMKFSKVRQGSFLARGKRTRKSKAEIQWEENRKNKRGRREAGVWETMPATSVRFLHWLGFELPTIHPPNEETTQALAFLGYDIMGRIIEKVSEKTKLWLVSERVGNAYACQSPPPRLMSDHPPYTGNFSSQPRTHQAEQGRDRRNEYSMGTETRGTANTRRY